LWREPAGDTLLPSRLLYLEAFGRRPRCLLHCRDGPSSETLINAALADLKIKARPADHRSTGLPGSPDDFRKPIAAYTEKWGKVIRLAGIKAD